MNDTIIINNYLHKIFTNDTPVVYLYSIGKNTSRLYIKDILLNEFKVMFSPAISEEIIGDCITEFFESKKKSYEKGEINLIPIY